MALCLAPKQGSPVPTSSCQNLPPQPADFNPPSFPKAILPLGPGTPVIEYAELVRSSKTVSLDYRLKICSICIHGFLKTFS